jgi:hypothetical protein
MAEQHENTLGIDRQSDSAYYHAPDVSERSERMRGSDEQTSHMFSYLSPEERVRADHPLPAIRKMTDLARHEHINPVSLAVAIYL